MTSYRDGKRTGHAATRLVTAGLFCTRHGVAAYLNRSERTVRAYCQPVACDVGTRAHLYDLEACEAVLRPLRRVA